MLVYVMLVSTCLLAACGESSGQEIVEKELAQKLDTYIQQVMGKFDIPGMTVAVTKGRKIIYTGFFGVRDLNTREPMKPEHLFHMASVSKPFVAAAIMQLVERGKMNLDERIVTYLPYFKLADDEALLVEFTPPAGIVYWGFALYNWWFESLDYQFNTVHSNNFIASASGDGSVQIVVSKYDPGIANWVSTDNPNQGTMLLRWTRPKPGMQYPDISTRLVKLDDLE